MKRTKWPWAFLLLAALAMGQTPIPTPPTIVPGFAIRPYAPRIGDTVRFTDHSVGNVVSWHWEFGDGATSDERHPTHVFTATGDFTVTLTITDSTGNTASLTLGER